MCDASVVVFMLSSAAPVGLDFVRYFVDLQE